MLASDHVCDAQHRNQFVGEVDLPECAQHILPPYLASESPILGEEPLLKESNRRFVLFPIQYPEVYL